VPPRLLRKILLIAIAIPLLIEAVCWAFIRQPLDPIRTVSMNNDIPGFKKEVTFTFGNTQVRYLDWTPGEKPAGTVRILVIGGWATWGLLQNAQDTWWGQMHKGLKDAGLNVQTAARGFERSGILQMAAGMENVVERLKPDILLLNVGFDDVVVHPLDYTYDKDRLSKLPGSPKDSTFKSFITQISQTVRLIRSRGASSEQSDARNKWGRTNHWKKWFEEMRAGISQLNTISLSREEDHDPLPEYFDGLKAFATIADRHGASLVITGEAALQDSEIGEDLQQRLMAYVTFETPRGGTDMKAARPVPGSVWREMRRFATTAEKFAADNKFPWFNLNDRIPRNAENFFTDVILTDAGSSEAAKAILPFITPIVKSKSGK
jgi:hypothetical protein